MSKPKAKICHEISLDNSVVKVGCYLRREEDFSSDADTYHLKKSHIISPKDEFIDLSPEDYERALDLTEKDWSKRGKTGRPAYPSGQIVRNQIRDAKNALLLIYLLNPEGANLPATSGPIVGYAMSFPKSKFNGAVSYAVKDELLERFDFDYESEIDDEAD